MPFKAGLKKIEILTAALLLYTAICYVAAVVRSYAIFKFPYVVEYGESSILSQVKTLFEGGFPYNQHSLEIHNYFSYTPLFQFLVSLNSHNPEQWLFAARLLNTFGLLAAGVFLALIFMQWKGPEKKLNDFVLPFLLWISWYPVFNWMALGRLDGLALFFQVLGMYLFFRPTKQILFQSLAMASFVLAFFTKQTAIWIPVSLFAYETTRKNRNPIWLLYFGGLAAGLIIFVIFSEGTLWAHLVKSNQNSFKMDLLVQSLRANALFHSGLLVIALVAFVKMDLKGANLLMVIMAVFCLPYILGLGREGSSVNFLLETCVVLTWFTTIGAQKMEKSRVGVVLGVLLLAGTLTQNIAFRWSFLKPKTESVSWSNYSAEARESTSRVIARMKEQAGEVWSEDISLLIFANKEVTFYPFEFLQSFSRGTLDEQIYLNKIRAKKIDLIVVENQYFRPPVKRFSDNMIREIVANYTLTSQDAYYLVYSPNTK